MPSLFGRFKGVMHEQMTSTMFYAQKFAPEWMFRSKYFSSNNSSAFDTCIATGDLWSKRQFFAILFAKQMYKSCQSMIVHDVTLSNCITRIIPKNKNRSATCEIKKFVSFAGR